MIRRTDAIKPAMKYIFLFIGLLFCSRFGYGQLKKLAVIGSSTAEGIGAQPAIDSSWVRMINYYYKYQNSTIDTVFNLALSGYDTYHGLPTGYTPAFGFSQPDPNRNITKANSLQPQVILVSYVSNNFQNYPIDSIMWSLQTIKDSANKAGRICFISTSQPRTQYSLADREKLRVVKDSILKRFGFYAINFYDSIVNNSDQSILTAYASPFDNIHLNNAGHKMLYRQVLAKDIFNITTIRSRKSGNWDDPSCWDRGLVPVSGDSVVVEAGHNISLKQSLSARGILIKAEGQLTIDDPLAHLTIGSPSEKDKFLNLEGTLLINSGKVWIYGTLHSKSGSVFSLQSGELKQLQ